MPFLLLLSAFAVVAPVFGSIEEIPATYLNATGGNSLWYKLIRDCRKPSVACIQKNVFEYFDDGLNAKDLTVSSFLKFTKNDVRYDDSDRREDDVEESSEARGFGPIEEVTDALRDKATRFMFTHDMELELPEFLFGGGVLKISPRSSDGSGALVKLDIEPKEGRDVANPRIFKKIKKFFSSKLFMALSAVLLVIKLLSVKFMFFLPMVMGVAAAKKLLLKVLLFIFPFLGYLFKLCPYYSPTKFHHHHHHLAHHHHIPKVPSLHGIELDHPPPGWHENKYHDDEVGYYSDGPSFTADFVNHRKNFEVAKPNRLDEENAIAYGSGVGGSGGESGQGHQPGVPPMGPLGHRQQPVPKYKSGPLSAAEVENMVLKAEKEAMFKARLQEEQKRVDVENKRLQDQIKASLKLQEKLKIQSLVAKQTSKIAAAYQHPNLVQPQIVHAVPAATSYLAHPPMIQSLPHAQPQPVYHQQGPLYSVPVSGSLALATNQVGATATNHMTQAVQLPAYDQFYSPILQKIDKILVELGFFEEPCRERLICSMYKDPEKFSPHSNLISAELSRDASELKKPASSNAAVIRFYKYVQAARDGQDKRDCLKLYAACAIVTE